MHAAGIHFPCLRYFRPEDVEPGVGGDLRCEDVAPHRGDEEALGLHQEVSHSAAGTARAPQDHTYPPWKPRSRAWENPCAPAVFKQCTAYERPSKFVSQPRMIGKCPGTKSHKKLSLRTSKSGRLVAEMKATVYYDFSNDS